MEVERVWKRTSADEAGGIEAAANAGFRRRKRKRAAETAAAVAMDLSREGRGEGIEEEARRERRRRGLCGEDVEEKGLGGEMEKGFEAAE